MHHLLTNRDPRSYPLFAYQSVRSLNSELSSEIDRMLSQALMADITKRYQNAAAMKRDIDEILMQHFGMVSTSSYLPGISRPIGTTGTQEEVLVCPNCGANYPPDDQFCSNCGTYLDSFTIDTPATMNVNSGGAPSAGSITLTDNGGTSGSITLRPGTWLENGRYVIEKILGQGGMGAALLAKDTLVSNKQVVIKELISDNSDPVRRQEDILNFELEVKTLAHLDHPLIPIVTDSFQEGSHYFMVQDYVIGENLEEWTDRVNKPMPERLILGYASQVLDILDYLEQQTPPIIHRDIKPANIIVSRRDKHAHLVDFGIARALVNKNAKRKQETALGTPGYAPPEQYQGNADPRSDLYALAATMHHLLTNHDPREHPPFAYPPIRLLNPQISAETERVLTRALNNDPNARYQSAAAMKNDIDEILGRRFGAGMQVSILLGHLGLLEQLEHRPL